MKRFLIFTIAVLSFVVAPALSMAGAQPEAGLVGHWLLAEQDFDGTDTIYDKAGSNDGTGTNIASADFVAGYDGKDNTAIDFDDRDGEFINCGNDSSLSMGTDDWTISLWAAIAPGGSSKDAFIGKGATSNNDEGYAFTYDRDNDGLVFYISNGTARKILNSNTGLGVDDGIFRHYVVVADRSDVATFYVNAANSGSEAPLYNGTDISSADNLQIAKWGGGNYINASIQDIRIYNTALSATEVANLYNASKKTYTAAAPETGLVGHWTMDDNDINGTTLYDKAGS